MKSSSGEARNGSIDRYENHLRDGNENGEENLVEEEITADAETFVFIFGQKNSRARVEIGGIAADRSHEPHAPENK